MVQPQTEQVPVLLDTARASLAALSYRELRWAPGAINGGSEMGKRLQRKPRLRENNKQGRVVPAISLPGRGRGVLAVLASRLTKLWMEQYQKSRKRTQPPHPPPSIQTLPVLRKASPQGKTLPAVSPGGYPKIDNAKIWDAQVAFPEGQTDRQTRYVKLDLFRNVPEMKLAHTHTLDPLSGKTRR